MGGRVFFGIEPLDEALEGLGPGSLILITGDPGSGKTVLGVQFVHEGCRAGERCLALTVGYPERKFTLQAASLRRDMDRFVESGRLKVRSLEIPGSPVEAEMALFTVADEIEQFKPDRVFIDGLSQVLAVLGVSSAQRILSQRLLTSAEQAGATVMATIVPDALERPMLLGVEFLADAVVDLSMSEGERGGLVRKAKITKVRMASPKEPVVTFSISARRGGARVITLPHSLDTEEPLDLISTGIEGLDEMLGGGLPRSSLNILEGPVGSGKTVLGVSLAVSAAKMGRRSLIVSFETSKGTVLKLARSFGMTDGDEVGVVSVVPQALGPVEQFELIEELVEDAGSEFVLVDSLTAIEHAVGREGLIDFTRYLQWMAKERGITILGTQLGSGHFEKDTRAASLYADTIILLKLVERDGVLRREATVLKSRKLGVQGVRYLMEFSEGRIRFLRER